MSKVYTVTLEEDPATGDLLLPFPEDFLEDADWREGDILSFTVNGEVVVIVNKTLVQRKEVST